MTLFVAHANAPHLFTDVFLSRNASNLVRAFKIYIRPIVEYASLVCPPHKFILSMHSRASNAHLPKDCLDSVNCLTLNA